MHELAITESLVRLISDKASSGDFAKVNIVRLDIGRLSTVVPDSIEFCFDIVSKGTVAEGARLEITHKPGTADCIDCGSSVSGLNGYGEPCPQCGGSQLRVTGGTEILIRDLEVE